MHTKQNFTAHLAKSHGRSSINLYILIVMVIKITQKYHFSINIF